MGRCETARNNRSSWQSANRATELCSGERHEHYGGGTKPPPPVGQQCDEKEGVVEEASSIPREECTDDRGEEAEANLFLFYYHLHVVPLFFFNFHDD